MSDMTTVTGLWKKVSSDGTEYLSGTTNGGEIFTVWPNSFKDAENKPDYLLKRGQKDKVPF